MKRVLNNREWCFKYVLSVDSIWKVCVAHDYYTVKTEEFNTLARYIGHIIYEEDLEKIALNIKLHSVTLDTVYDIICNLSGHINLRPIRIDSSMALHS